MIVMKVKVGTGEEVVIIIVKKSVIEIRALELNLFKLITRVSYRRVCRQLKFIATCLTTL